MKTLLIALILLVSTQALCYGLEKDGFNYHPTCKEEFKPDTLSRHKYELRIKKGMYASGYCVAIL